MADEHWLARASLVVRTRYVHGAPQEDELVRHGRAGGALMLLGAVAGIGLLPVYPPRVDDHLAFVLAFGCLLIGVVMPWLPWERWRRPALLLPVVATIPVVFGGGGVDGSLDYYALFLPLVFLYMGLVFPLVYCAWTFAVCLGGLAVAIVLGQDPVVVPQVLLGTLLSAVAGAVLALQRRAEAQGYEAMGALAEAATRLGAATHRQQVAEVVAAATSELLAAQDVEVVLLGGSADATPVVARCGRALVLDAGDDDLSPARAREAVEALTSGPVDGQAPVREGASLASFQLVVTIPGPNGPHGVVVVERPRHAQGSDRFATRSLTLLAREAGHVLDHVQRTEELFTSSRTDALTGVGNRTVLGEAMEDSAPGDVFILADLDHFKQVNDTLGHAMGDKVLVAFAQVLRGTVRLNQVVARYGGEEFATVLPQANRAAVERHLHNVREAWAALDLGVTFSSGVSVRQEGETAAEALGRADKALYLAKSGGRNQDVVDPGAALLESVPAGQSAL